MAPSGRWAIALHGGAGTISKDTHGAPYEGALAAAMGRAMEVLETGVDNVEWPKEGTRKISLALKTALAAVESMENSELFNAGKGAVFNDELFIENEAAVMEGSTLRCGCVAGLTTIKNPARLATLVYATSRMQFIGFGSAERYARRYGAVIETRPAGYFKVEKRLEACTRRLAERAGPALDHDDTITTNKDAINTLMPGTETVGAAVCDGSSGCVAVVTSTGGQTAKMAGRIGDTPIIGAGSYADSECIALSGTGDGEEFLRLAAAARVWGAMKYGAMDAQRALDNVVHTDFSPGTGGFVAVTPAGQALSSFNSAGMFRALCDSTGKDIVRIWED